MTVNRPVTDENRETFRRLYDQGLGRNAIAREMDRPAGTVTNLARQHGVTFDRAATAEATLARQTELADLRTQLAHALTIDAINLREQMWQPTLVYNFGGKDNTYEERTLDEAPAETKRALMLTAAAAVDRSLKLVPPESGSGIPGARSLLADLGRALGIAAEALDGAPAEG